MSLYVGCGGMECVDGVVCILVSLRLCCISGFACGLLVDF